jgi:hypothetical protein
MILKICRHTDSAGTKKNTNDNIPQAEVTTKANISMKAN